MSWPVPALLGWIAVLALAAAAPPFRDDVHGTYRLHGTARVSARPLPSREVEAHADAVLRPGAGPRDVRAHVAAEGYRCELDARVGEGGHLSFPAGQRCALDIDEPDARGRVEARLRSGGGRIGGGRLGLELSWDLSGSVRLRSEQRRIEVLGREIDVPGGWMPEVPVEGEAQVVVAGRRDASRATGP